jgi:transcriptional regulator with XRE-family HTH domain
MQTIKNTQRATRLKIFFLRNGLTHKTIAKKLGVSQAHVTNVLNDRILALDFRERLVREIGIPRYLIYSGLIRKAA